MSSRDDKARKAIDDMTKEYVETGKKGGITLVNEEAVRRHVISIAEKAEKRRDNKEYRNKR